MLSYNTTLYHQWIRRYKHKGGKRVSENPLVGGEPPSNDIRWLWNFRWALVGGLATFCKTVWKSVTFAQNWYTLVFTFTKIFLEKFCPVCDSLLSADHADKKKRRFSWRRKNVQTRTKSGYCVNPPLVRFRIMWLSSIFAFRLQDERHGGSKMKVDWWFHRLYRWQFICSRKKLNCFGSIWRKFLNQRQAVIHTKR